MQSYRDIARVHSSSYSHMLTRNDLYVCTDAWVHRLSSCHKLRYLQHTPCHTTIITTYAHHAWILIKSNSNWCVNIPPSKSLSLALELDILQRICQEIRKHLSCPEVLHSRFSLVNALFQPEVLDGYVPRALRRLSPSFDLWHARYIVLVHRHRTTRMSLSYDEVSDVQCLVKWVR